jgi:hypothetical protein
VTDPDPVATRTYAVDEDPTDLPADAYAAEPVDPGYLEDDHDAGDPA